MPKVNFLERSMNCAHGDVLRDVLRKNGLSPHNGQSQWLNCKGLGSCGTCAVEVTGERIPPLTKMEKWRLDFPPHKRKNRLRLACQFEVQGDIQVAKHSGFWGHII